jgi:hypothetical protein
MPPAALSGCEDFYNRPSADCPASDAEQRFHSEELLLL